MSLFGRFTASRKLEDKTCRVSAKGEWWYRICSVWLMMLSLRNRSNGSEWEARDLKVIVSEYKR